MYDIQTEKAVLGCMLIDLQCYNRGIINLTRKDFYEQKNKIIFDKMRELFEKNEPCDLITCTSDYIDIEYLTEVIDIVPSSQAFSNYFNSIKKYSTRREYIERVEQIKNYVYGAEHEDIVDLKNEILAKIDLDNGYCNTTNTNIDYIGEKTIEMMESNNESKCSYSYSWIDKNTSGVTPKLIYLGARPSVGKTTFAMNLALNLARKGLKIVIFSLETTKEQIFKKLISIHGKIKFENVNNYKNLPESEKEKIKTVANELKKLNIKIYDNIYSIENIRAECRSLSNTNNLDYVIVDYIQLCDTSKKIFGNNERVSYISRQFKLMQMEFKVQFLVLCQLSRESAKESRVPKLTDLRDSGSLEQDANDVWFLHDNASGEYTEDKVLKSEISFIIAKQREGQRDIYTDLLFYKDTQLFMQKCPF